MCRIAICAPSRPLIEEDAARIRPAKSEVVRLIAGRLSEDVRRLQSRQAAVT